MSSSGTDIPAGSLQRLCRTVMRPLISIFIRSGMPFGAFADICRSTYVEVARSEFGIGGRPTNISRVALLAGLSRKQVRRELDFLADKATTEELPDGVRPASRVLLGWHTDARFLDATGAPQPLTEAGTERSFAQLYEAYSGKVVPVTTLLKELKQIGAVESTADGRLRVLTRSFVPQQSDPAALQRVCLAVHDLATTVGYNLYRNHADRARFERFATNQLIPAEALDQFRDFLESEGQAFLERADDWLARHESRDLNHDLIRIGVGVYQIAPTTETHNDDEADAVAGAAPYGDKK